MMKYPSHDQEVQLPCHSRKADANHPLYPVVADWCPPPFTISRHAVLTCIEARRGGELREGVSTLVNLSRPKTFCSTSLIGPCGMHFRPKLFVGEGTARWGGAGLAERSQVKPRQTQSNLCLLDPCLQIFTNSIIHRAGLSRRNSWRETGGAARSDITWFKLI